MSTQLPAEIAEAIERLAQASRTEGYAMSGGTAETEAQAERNANSARLALDAVILKHLGGWQPISECSPGTSKIIGWCTFGPNGRHGEARACSRYINHAGHAHPWTAHGYNQTVTHFKPWPTDEPPATDLGRAALAEEGRGT